jgi:histidinol-phosphate aminotransferase
LVAAELDRALAFANAFAAEHVLLSGRAAEALAAEVRCSGTVYVGAGASVAFGDYLTGCNHVLPTAAAARFASGLSVSDFLRFSSIQSVSASAAASLSADAQCLASEEGLDGHAEAARLAGLQASAATQPVARLEKLARVTAAPNAAVDLSDNTNRFGVPPSLARQSAVDVSRYPTPYADALRQRLAERFATTVDHVVTGCGSDDVIASTIAALTSPGEALAMMRPCFSMVEQFAEIQSLRIVDLTQVERASLVYLGAPNNPTGTDVSWAFVESILARTQGVVLLDEAYVEYCGRESFASKALAHQRVVVTRTFSKAWGMAGLRVGYGIACPQLIAQIEKARGPYKVSKQSEAAVCLALEQDTAWVNAIAAQTVKLREDLISDLRELGLAPLPSRANFVLVPVSENAVQLSQRLTRLGVSVRPFADLPELGDALRITVGPRSDLDALLRAWRSL